MQPFMSKTLTFLKSIESEILQCNSLDYSLSVNVNAIIIQKLCSKIRSNAEMINRKRKKRRFLFTLICLSSLASLVLLHRTGTHMDDVQPKTIQCDFNDQIRNETIKYIFQIERWRNFLAKDQLYSNKHQTSWCDVPQELQIIANAICRFYEVSNCTRLPCHLIYSSPTSISNVQCTSNYQIIKTKIKNIQSNFQCKLGYSLDLFLKDSQNQSYPSIIADPFSPISNDLYVKILNNQYRSCNSMWGVYFNYESLSYYPWTGDREKLKLFNVSFGYDRSVYDFIPDPWLMNYIDQIIDASRRLSLEQVMKNKQPINVASNKEIYWTNLPSNSIGENKSSESSYVKSPILWMNSNCRTLSKRTEYVTKMMKFIDIDNFGTCGKDIRPLPQHIAEIQGSVNQSLKNIGSYNWVAGKLELTNNYLFTIAIENSVSYDYITEKLWQPLLVGSIPIYLGAPNVDDWLPCRTDCIIDLRKFATPKDAALFIKKVATNRTLYESYHQWRNEPIREKLQKMLNYFSSMRNYNLECVLCDMSRQVDRGQSSEETKKKIIEIVGRI
ncbi:hypothetical protein I4U23_017397 [Adineta vaga]|nr:hypothetical protein I4U23_017397 [Adineta vaga]